MIKEGAQHKKIEKSKKDGVKTKALAGLGMAYSYLFC
jgi:hypothetical protein